MPFAWSSLASSVGHHMGYSRGQVAVRRNDQTTFTPHAKEKVMRNLIPVFVTLLIVACGDSENSQTAIAGEDSAGAVDFCTCVNEPLNTDARLKACGDLIDSMTPEETATRSIACREALPVPEGGPDLCFCLRTTTTDEEIMQACEALIPEDMTPMQLTRTLAECSR
jgi:hypothetical protein